MLGYTINVMMYTGFAVTNDMKRLSNKRGDFNMKLRSEMPELNGASQWLNGKLSKHDLIGKKPTLIHFWSASCELCIQSMSKIKTFRDEYKDKLNVLAVHMPRIENDLNIKEIKEIAKKHDISQPIFIDNEMKLSDVFENQSVPAYFVFDHNGKLSHSQMSDTSMKALVKHINRILEVANDQT